jgi:acyl carrier protein
MKSIEILVPEVLERVLQECQVKVEKPLQTEIYGPNGCLSSLNTILLVVEIEKEISENYGVAINLLNEQSFEFSKSPFKNVDSIIEHVKHVMAKAQ